MKIEIETAIGPSVLQVDSPEAVKHFTEISNHTGDILHQTKQGLYNRFFKGKTDLALLDIGANIGLVTLYAQPVCRRIVAVEPTPAHCEILRELTAPFGNIEVVQAALSPINGPVNLFLCQENTTMNSLLRNGKESLRVDGLALSNLCERFRSRVDLCKVDIEGGEYPCLTLDQLKTCRRVIQAYYVETHPCAEFGQVDGRKRLEALFAQCGYFVETLGPETTYAYQ